MRVFKIVFENIKMLFIQLFSLGAVSVSYPIRVEHNVLFSHRKGGKINIGKRASINRNSKLAVTENATLIIGSCSGVGNNNVVVARERITIGNNVMIGPNVCIYDHDHIFKKKGIMRAMGFFTSPVTIEDNVWLGAGVLVLKGVTIGEGSIVAAGTVVTRDVPPNSIIYNKRELIIKDRFQ